MATCRGVRSLRGVPEQDCETLWLLDSQRARMAQRQRDAARHSTHQEPTLHEVHQHLPALPSRLSTPHPLGRRPLLPGRSGAASGWRVLQARISTTASGVRRRWLPNGAAACLLVLRAASPPPPSRLGPSETAKPPSEPQPSSATKRPHGALSTGGKSTLSPMKLRRKHSKKRGPSPPLKMAKELEDDDPFQAPKPKREATSSRQAPSGAAGGSRRATSSRGGAPSPPPRPASPPKEPSSRDAKPAPPPAPTSRPNAASL